MRPVTGATRWRRPGRAQAGSCSARPTSGAGPLTLTVRVARDGPAPATVVCQAGTQWAPLGLVMVPAGGSRYDYTDVSATLPGLADVARTDLYLVLDGPVRLAAFRVEQ